MKFKVGDEVMVIPSQSRHAVWLPDELIWTIAYIEVTDARNSKFLLTEGWICHKSQIRRLTKLDKALR